MKCPFCESERISPSKKEGFYYCANCESIVRDIIKDDPNLTEYKYKTKSMRTREPDPKDIFAIADDKYGKKKYEVVAMTPDHFTEYSLLFGQSLFITIRKPRKLKQ